MQHFIAIELVRNSLVFGLMKMVTVLRGRTTSDVVIIVIQIDKLIGVTDKRAAHQINLAVIVVDFRRFSSFHRCRFRFADNDNTATTNRIIICLGF